MGLADIARERLPIRAAPADLNLNVRVDSLQGIRSFVRRESRMTRAQQRAFAELWSRFGIDAGAARLEPEQIFGRRRPLVLEIGFGDGESLAAMAAADPETDYLGIEVHRPGIGHLLLQAAQLELGNLRILCADAMESVERQLPDECLDRIQIFFPDPWPKNRHHKRRLIQASFMALLASKAKSDGHLLIATDCEDYARSILDSLNAAPEWLNTVAGNGFALRPIQRLLTRFEQRSQQLGHVVREIAFVRRVV
jgi:tRNA (guanine-N7-)-methyltransferase